MKKFNLVLNNLHSLEAAKARLDSYYKHTADTGQIYQLLVQPFQKPKTYKQIRAIHVLCKQLSMNKENEWGGHDEQYWKRYYKLRSYIPLLKDDALERGDTELIDLIASASTVLYANRGKQLYKYDLGSILTIYNDYLRVLKKKHSQHSLVNMLDAAKRNFMRHASDKVARDSSDDYSLQDFIADNPAFSFSNAKKEHLTSVIDFILNDAARKGIVLDLEKD